jgi:hypothetical protein
MLASITRSEKKNGCLLDGEDSRRLIGSKKTHFVKATRFNSKTSNHAEPQVLELPFEQEQALAGPPEPLARNEPGEWDCSPNVRELELEPSDREEATERVPVWQVAAIAGSGLGR